MSDTGLIIRRLRKEANLTQEAVAEAVEVSANYVSLIERGQRTPSWRFLVRFAGLLRVPVSNLLESAGLVERPAVNEAHIVEMIAAYPRLAAVFEYARQDRKLLAEMERFAALLIREYEAEHGGEQGGGTATEDPG